MGCCWELSRHLTGMWGSETRRHHTFNCCENLDVKDWKPSCRGHQPCCSKHQLFEILYAQTYLYHHSRCLKFVGCLRRLFLLYEPSDETSLALAKTGKRKLRLSPSESANAAITFGSNNSTKGCTVHGYAETSGDHGRGEKA